MDKKLHLTLMDYMCIGFVILVIVGAMHSYSSNKLKAQEAKIEAAYTEGYSQGYYDCENNLPYDEDR